MRIYLLLVWKGEDEIGGLGERREIDENVVEGKEMGWDGVGKEKGGEEERVRV